MHNTDLDIHVRLREIDDGLDRFERRAVLTGASISALLILAFTAYLAMMGVPL
jgi:hypothetical protein